MIRLLGINIPDNNYVQFGLTKIFGIGQKRALKICNYLKIKKNKTFLELNQCQISNIRKYLDKYCLEGELRKEIYFNIKKKIDLNNYQGLRHKKKLPVHGQRTRTNSRTVRKIR